MDNPVVGAAIAFAVGAFISFCNYRLSEYFLKNKPEGFSLVSLIRQAVQVLYLVILFFSASYLPWDRTFVLIGGALGITLPMLLFTVKLLKTNRQSVSQTKEREEDSDG